MATKTKEITKTKATLPAPRLTSKELLKIYLAERKNILKFVNSQLIDDIDYGHTAFNRDGTPIGRKCLKKPGAEKIAIHLQLDPVFIPDHDTWQMLGAPDGTVVYICFLLTRADKREALKQLKALGIESKLEIYHNLAVAEGRGAKSIAGTYKGAERMNTIIKIAQKCSQIDAVLRVEGLSEIFDQDTIDDNGNAIDFGKGNGNKRDYDQPRETRDVTPQKEEQPKTDIGKLHSEIIEMLEIAPSGAKKAFTNIARDSLQKNDYKRMESAYRTVKSQYSYWNKNKEA